MTSKRILVFISIHLLILPSTVDAFVAPTQQTKCLTTHLLSSMPHLYRDEPNPMDSEYIKREEHDTKHSSFHVDQGLETYDDASDPAHSIHHHIIDVDHKKLDDLGLKAQKAWKPVNVHEMEVDAVSVITALFMLFAAVLFGAGLSG